MATRLVHTARGHLRVLVLSLATAAVVAIVAYTLGGGSWLTSPTIWGTTLFVALVLLVGARARRHLSRNALLGLPIAIGGAAAIAFGAWDHLPWLASPALWLGVLVSALCGVWLVRSGRAQPREAVEGIVIGLIAFGLGLLAAYAGILFFWVVWRPI